MISLERMKFHGIRYIKSVEKRQKEMVKNETIFKVLKNKDTTSVKQGIEGQRCVLLLDAIIA